jgi:hypothetical protein
MITTFAALVERHVLRPVADLELGFIQGDPAFHLARQARQSRTLALLLDRLLHRGGKSLVWIFFSPATNTTHATPNSKAVFISPSVSVSE